jgi:hypothetical protein
MEEKPGDRLRQIGQKSRNLASTTCLTRRSMSLVSCSNKSARREDQVVTSNFVRPYGFASALLPVWSRLNRMLHGTDTQSQLNRSMMSKRIHSQQKSVECHRLIENMDITLRRELRLLCGIKHQLRSQGLD